jgi:hypothetical protein
MYVNDFPNAHCEKATAAAEGPNAKGMTIPNQHPVLGYKRGAATIREYIPNVTKSSISKG